MVRNNKKIIANYRLWLQDKDANLSFGDGRWTLLKMIDETGSLSAAGRELGISYRKAWGDLKKAELLFGSKLVLRQRGGQKGGRMTLTEDGRRILEAFSEVKKKTEAFAEKIYANKFKGLGLL